LNSHNCKQPSSGAMCMWCTGVFECAHCRVVPASRRRCVRMGAQSRIWTRSCGQTGRSPCCYILFHVTKTCILQQLRKHPGSIPGATRDEAKVEPAPDVPTFVPRPPLASLRDGPRMGHGLPAGSGSLPEGRPETQSSATPRYSLPPAFPD